MHITVKSRGALAITMAALIQACGFTAPAMKNKNSSAAGPQNGSIGGLVPENIQFLKANYQINAKALGFKMCDGAIALEVNVAAKAGNTPNLLKIPEGRLKCALVGEIDLAKLVSGFAATPPPGQNPVEIKDNVISLSVLGSGSYSPARPFLPAFVSATPDQLRSINLTRALTLTDQKLNKTSQGSANLRVLEVGATYKSEQLAGKPLFKNVLIFELKHSGFDDALIMNNMLWDRFKMWISLEPFAILRIEMDATVQDAIDASGNPAAGDRISGIITPFMAGIGSMFFGQFGSLLGSVGGTLVAQGVKHGTVAVTMDLLSMENLDSMIAMVNQTRNGPSSQGQVIQ